MSKKEDVDDSFLDWNPMEEAYKNENFNVYKEGPGAELDSSVFKMDQNANNSNGSNNKRPYLYFPKVPSKITQHMLYKICSQYGKVIAVKNFKKCNYFVDCETIADMEAIRRNLRHNDYGLSVYLGNSHQKQSSNHSVQSSSCSDSLSTPRRENRMPEEMEKLFEKGPKTNESKKLDKSEFNFTDKCAHCGVACFLTCARCKTFYCGSKCQAKDWGKHRLRCGKPIGLFQSDGLNPDEKENETDQTESGCDDSKNNAKVFTKGCPLSGSKVVVTAIVKSNVVFIRSYDPEENLKYFDVLKKVASREKSLKPFEKEPDLGSFVLTKFEDKINRAIILGLTNDGRYRVCFVDYGGIHVKSLNELYQADQEITSLLILTNPIMLKNVPDCFLTNELRTYMYSFLESKPLTIIYEDKDFQETNCVFGVELIDKEANININEAIIKLCTPEIPTENDIFFENELEKIDLPEGDNIELVIMDNSMLNVGLLACTTKSGAVQIQKFQTQVDDYVRNLTNCTSYAPRLGELCIAQYDVDKNWYRGVCCELVGDGFPTILFLDYGNMAMVDIKFIRPYPRQLNLPIVTRECIVKDLPSFCNDKLVKRAEELIPCCSYLICDNLEKHEENDSTVHVVTVKKIIQTLIQENLLVPEPDNEE